MTVSYTVVLVEDEQLVCQEIAITTPWADLGLELVATCADGIEGERTILELQPDVVITDIRLPGQDGLSMLEKCAVSHAVILSGYTDFSYTRSAIRLGVFDYLQKPIDSRQFHETLSCLVEKMRQEDQEIERLKTSDPELIALPRSVENHVINSVISFIVSVVVNYVGSMHFVFERRDDLSRRREFSMFVVLSAIGLVINSACIWVGTGIFGSGALSVSVTKVVATIIVSVWNFVSRKHWLEAK